ncbi:hypothetical protein IEQ34_015367 [Dendrobium chrysotoxum]|uniref:Uncharacterized protein n=1 Tax=Dendrobium chrysotoxum TaxID=161865 RepID=A0AAV7GGH6_DENCH|nr:hypothetical protein IEQ34_015367 [Dendrobium chrysotoxum]
MFRNKILVRAYLPSPSFHPFVIVQLSLSDSSSPIEIEALCWKLSRRWRVACLHPSPSSIFVSYQGFMMNVVGLRSELIDLYPGLLLVVFYKVEEEEEVVRSAILIARVVECWLRSLMLEKSWGCIGDSTFVNSTFASDEEKKYFQALNVVPYICDNFIK